MGKLKLFEMSKCIYCFSTDNLSNSHIIPESLGGSEELRGFVCKKCNDKFGNTFEAIVASELSFYRFIIQIKTKGKIAKTEAKLKMFDSEIPVCVGAGGIPRNVRPIFHDRKIIVGAASPKELTRIVRRYNKSGIPFDIKNITPIKAELIFPSQNIAINSDDFLRLASKIAFEKYCSLRPTNIFDDEYNLLRDFVNKGLNHGNKRCFLIFDLNLITLIGLPFPFHGVMLIRYDKYEGAIIVLFGLFFYFVLLNSKAIVLQDDIRYFYVNPRLKGMREALILKRNYSLKDIFNLCIRGTRNSDDYNKRMINKYARDKFNGFIKNKF